MNAIALCASSQHDHRFDTSILHHSTRSLPGCVINLLVGNKLGLVRIVVPSKEAILTNETVPRPRSLVFLQHLVNNMGLVDGVVVPEGQDLLIVSSRAE